MKTPVVSLTAKDFRFDYYRGSGKGGQKRNKTSNACRCTHEASGVQHYSEESRSQAENRLSAWKKVVDDPKFRAWLRLETMKKTKELADIERKVDEDMRQVRIEVKNEQGLWVEEAASPEDIPVEFEKSIQ